MSKRDPNVDFFLRAVEERFTAFKGALSSLVAALCSEKIDDKKKSAEEVCGTVESLMSIISNDDHPSWLRQIQADLNTFRQNINRTNASNKLMLSIIKLSPHIEAHRWEFDRSSSISPVKFEEIFKEIYQGSNGPDLFQKLLDNLQSIVDSGEVDSITAIDALNKLIATIKANMRGTYFQAVGTTHFVNSVLRNYLWKLLKKMPAIGDLLDAVGETLEEMDGEMNDIHRKVRFQLQKDSMGDFEALEYQAHKALEDENHPHENS